MRLYVPACGDRITLEAEWSFRLYLERRNMAYAKTIGAVEKDRSMWAPIYIDDNRRSGIKSVNASLPAGTVLECDRVYVRQYNKSRIAAKDDYDSITWKLIGPKGKARKHGRFWVKLTDANAIEFDPERVDKYQNRVKLPALILRS